MTSYGLFSSPEWSSINTVLIEDIQYIKIYTVENFHDVLHVTVPHKAISGPLNEM
jgi:hypothetical protein